MRVLVGEGPQRIQELIMGEPGSTKPAANLRLPGRRRTAGAEFARPRRCHRE